MYLQVIQICFVFLCCYLLLFIEPGPIQFLKVQDFHLTAASVNQRQHRGHVKLHRLGCRIDRRQLRNLDAQSMLSIKTRSLSGQSEASTSNLEWRLLIRDQIQGRLTNTNFPFTLIALDVKIDNTGTVSVACSDTPGTDVN